MRDTQARVESILGIYPNVTFTVEFMDNPQAVSVAYWSMYKEFRPLYGFYCRKDKTIYCIRDRFVLAHELAHAVLEWYFHQEIPEELHELIANHVAYIVTYPNQQL